MASYIIYGGNVNTNIAQFDLVGGGGTGEELVQVAIQLRTGTPESAPGQGTLLCTMTYFDGDIVDQFNLSINLSAANVSKSVFPAVWHDLSQPVTLEFAYIGPGGVDGDADVKVMWVDL